MHAKHILFFGNFWCFIVSIKRALFITACTYTSGVAIPFLGIEFSKGNIIKLFSFAAHCSAAVSVAISARGILFLD